MTSGPKKQRTPLEQIREHLHTAFDTHVLDVRDDSARHAGHREAALHGGGHFTVAIVAEAFEGRSRLERHRMVYAVLKPLIGTHIHALALTALTPAEHKKS